MGYKLAGCDVLGCVEIDPKMIEIYRKNHNPKYSYLMDIRDFNKIPNDQLPPELFDLDILDGSPPCTTFSVAGLREETWGKKKKFREGQKEQTLDDLSFVFIETAKKLKPRVVVMENVEGLLLGDAFNYVRQIYVDFKASGYKVWHWLCKGEKMGVPQTRHRTIFIAIREDLGIDPQVLDMTFNYEPVTYTDIKDGTNRPMKPGAVFTEIAKKAIDTDDSIYDTKERLGQKGSGFQTYYVRKNDVMPTIRTKNDCIDLDELAYIGSTTIRNASTFPQDYDFIGDAPSIVGFVCGMSVPPVMMKRVVTRLIEQGVFDYKLRRDGD